MRSGEHSRLNLVKGRVRDFAPIAGSVACLMIAPAGGPVSLSPQIIRAPKPAFMGVSVTLRVMKKRFLV